MNKLLLFLSFFSFSAFALEGEVVFLKGFATLSSSPTNHLKVKDKIPRGSVVKTGKDSFIRVRFKGGLSFQLGSQAELKMDVGDVTKDTDSRLEIVKGDLLTYLKSNGKKQERLKIKSPNATMGIRGTVLYVGAKPGASDLLCTCEGEVRAESEGAEQTFVTKNHDSPVELKSGFPMANKQLMMDGHNDDQIAALKKL